jgi:hypothetical protein
MVQLRRDHAGRLICQMRTGRETPSTNANPTTKEDLDESLSAAVDVQQVWAELPHRRHDPDLIEMQDGTLVMAFGQSRITRSMATIWRSASTTARAGRTWFRSPRR